MPPILSDAIFNASEFLDYLLFCLEYHIELFPSINTNLAFDVLNKLAIVDSIRVVTV
jgi:hypothetical protein